MKLVVKRVYTLVEMVDVPAVCPKCETRLTTLTMGYLAIGFDPYAQECGPSPDASRDGEWGDLTHGEGDVITTGYACRECGHVLAGTDGAKPLDRAPGPHADIDQIPWGRQIRRVIRDSPCWLAVADVRVLLDEEDTCCELTHTILTNACAMLEAEGWIERAPDSMGVHYYFKEGRID